MFDALDADQGIGDCSDLRPFALDYQDLQAMLVIKVHVHPRHDVPLKVVLDVREFSSEAPYMVIIDEGDRGNRLAVRLAIPLLGNELIADQIA